MEKTKVKRTIKSVVIKLSIAFLIIVALLTYFSSTIDNYLLPHVTVTYGGEGTLKYQLNTTSTLEYPKGNDYTSPTAIHIGKVFIKNGQSVKSGDRLVQYDATEFADTKDNLYLNVFRLQNQLDSLYTTYYNAEDDVTAQSTWNSIGETQIELNMAQRAYDHFIEQFDDDGCILAVRDLIVTEVSVKAGDTVASGDKLFSYSTSKPELFFRFNCDITLESFVYVGSALDVRLSIEAGEGKTRLAKATAIVTQKKETDNGTECTARLSDVELFGSEINPAEGDTVMINTEFESQPYRHIVMKSAIQNGSYIYVIVKTADEKRYVNQVPVTIIDESDFYAAVEMGSENLPIVLTATKELTDGQRVIVDG